MLVKLLNGLLSLITAPESDKSKTLGPLGFRILGEEHTRELTERAEELVQIAFTDLVSKLIKKIVNNFDFEIKNNTIFRLNLIFKMLDFFPRTSSERLVTRRVCSSSWLPLPPSLPPPPLRRDGGTYLPEAYFRTIQK